MKLKIIFKLRKYFQNQNYCFKTRKNYFFNLLPKFIDNFKNCNFTFDGKIRPIFVMGLPRSGTTLVENIICSGLKSIKSAESLVLSVKFLETK